jgi:hypothetical protein
MLFEGKRKSLPISIRLLDGRRSLTSEKTQLGSGCLGPLWKREVWDPAAEPDVPYERLFRELEAVQATLTPSSKKSIALSGRKAALIKRWQPSWAYDLIPSRPTSTTFASAVEVSAPWLGDE